MGHPAREPPNVRPTGRRWVHLSCRTNAAPPIHSRPLGEGLLETGAGMGEQGALHAGTGTVFHAALVPSLDSYHPQSSVRNSAKRGIHHCLRIGVSIIGVHNKHFIPKRYKRKTTPTATRSRREPAAPLQLATSMVPVPVGLYTVPVILVRYEYRYRCTAVQ